ncbi:MAG: matrixin family metalloprotease, partial [Candidatus Saccharicenans sp.]|nr:matrixin family metalloprotease [Candidatus Saccharicenans sp.]
GSTIAVTYTWYNRTTGIIIEFDMMFYDGWKYFSFDNACTSACNGGFYLSIIAAHEFGHAIGLDHNDCTNSLMYPYADYCETELTRDVDISCARTIY